MLPLACSNPTPGVLLVVRYSSAIDYAQPNGFSGEVQDRHSVAGGLKRG